MKRREGGRKAMDEKKRVRMSERSSGKPMKEKRVEGKGSKRRGKVPLRENVPSGNEQ